MHHCTPVRCDGLGSYMYGRVLAKNSPVLPTTDGQGPGYSPGLTFGDACQAPAPSAHSPPLPARALAAGSWHCSDAVPQAVGSGEHGAGVRSPSRCGGVVAELPGRPGQEELTAAAAGLPGRNQRRGSARPPAAGHWRRQAQLRRQARDDAGTASYHLLLHRGAGCGCAAETTLPRDAPLCQKHHALGCAADPNFALVVVTHGVGNHAHG
jgi:hypothetical protein